MPNLSQQQQEKQKMAMATKAVGTIQAMKDSKTIEPK